MALITKLTKTEKRGAAQHSETDATYFFTEEGFLQIDTYGSKDRQSEPKLSQSIQFSPEIMQTLFEIWTRRLVEERKGPDANKKER